MADIDEIRQQTQSARALVEQKKQEAAQIQAQLQQQEQSLPNVTSQEALRGQKFGEGMQGRIFRQQVQSAQGEIARKQQMLQEYGQGLTGYEEQVAGAEQQLRGYDTSISSWNLAVQLALQKVNPTQIQDGEVRSYVQDIYEQQNIEKSAELFNVKLQAAVDNFNNGTPLDVAFKNFNIEQLKKAGILNFEEATQPEITQAKDKFNLLLNQPSTFNVSQLPRTDRTQLQSYTPTGEMFPLVSAASNASQVPILWERSAPTFTQRLTSTLKPEGEKLSFGTVVSAPVRTLKFASEEFARQEDIRQQKYGDYEQSQGMINIASAIPQVAAYSNPYTAPVVMVSSGLEKYSTPSGRAYLTQLSQDLQSKNINPTAANIIAYSLPAAEIGLGVLGARAKIKEIQVSRELKALENTPLKIIGQRIDNSGKGVDVLMGYKKVGSSEYLVKVQQPYFQAGETRTALEGGQGTAYRLQGNKLTAIKFESGGRVTSVETAPKIIRGQVIQEFKDLQAGGGRIFTKQTGRGDYTIKSGMVTPTRAVLEARGTIQKINEPSVWNTFTGISKEGEGYFDVISGQAKKIRYYPKENRLTILSKPENIGRIRTTKPVSTYDLYFSGGKALTTTQKATSPIYAEQLLSKAIRLAAPQVKTSSNFMGITGLVSAKGTAQQTKTITKQEVKQNVLSMELQPSLVKQETKQRAISKVKTILQERTRQKQNMFSGMAEVLGLSSNERLRSLQVPISVMKQETKQRAVQKQVSMLKSLFERTPTKPFIPVIVFRSSGGNGVKGKIVKIDTGRYVVYVRRYGQDNIIGEAETLEEAKIMLKNNLQQTLAASGFISKSGERQPIQDLFGDMFAPSKRESGRVVQRRGKRLSSSAEIWGIQQARKNKAKIINNKNWLGGGRGKKNTKKFKWW